MINVVNVTLPSNCGEADYCILLCFFTMRWKNWIFFTCFLMSSGTLDQPLALPSASATDDEAGHRMAISILLLCARETFPISSSLELQGEIAPPEVYKCSGRL